VIQRRSNVTALIRKVIALLRDFRRRRVFRAAIVYGGVAVATLGVLDIARDLIPWLDAAFPALVLSAVILFPVVVIAAWVFDLTPDGIRLHVPEDGAEVTTGHRIAAGAVMVAASVVFGGTLIFLWANSELGSDGPPVSAAVEDPLDPTRIAVLYFDDHSPGAELGYLANGLTEDLINALVNVEGLRVTSRNGVKPFRENPRPMEVIARELGVGTLVEGSVTGSGGVVRATAQLIDGDTGDHLWSEQFEAETTDVLALQDDLANAIALTLRERLGISVREREARARATNQEAWRAYQEARAVLDEARGYDLAGADGVALDLYDRAEEGLLQSIEFAPNWVDPLVTRGWLAWYRSVSLSSNMGFMRPEDGPELLAIADRAVELSGGSPAALELRGAVRFELAEATRSSDPGLREGAREDLRAAVELAPRQARALAYLSWISRIDGDFSGARIYAERAMDADAFLAEADDVIYRLFEANLELKDWSEAQRWCVEGRRRYPDQASFALCRLYLASLQPEVGTPEEGWALLDSLRMTDPGDPWEYQFRYWGGIQVARLLARNAMPDSAEAVLVAYRASPEDRPYFAYDEASVRLALGDPDGALDLLEVYLEVSPDRRSYLADDWLFEELWADPRFVELTGGE
jgi:serine/threonine-protein kinase